MASVIELETGWTTISKDGIDKLCHLLDTNFDKSSRAFTREQYAQIYTTCYNMCTQRAPMNWSQALYDRHGETVGNYLRDTVLPALQSQRDKFLLQELVLRWKNHEIFNKWLFRFFMYLDRYYVTHHGMPKLKEAGLRKFKTVVFDVIKRDAVQALLAEITRDREGEMVDQSLVKDVVQVFVEMGEGSLDTYRSDLETPLLSDTAEYYARKAQGWLATDSTPTYMVKAEEALQAEQKRVERFLDRSSEDELLRVVEDHLIARHKSQLLDKEGSGCRVLLRDDKKSDLARMYRLFKRVNDGLVGVAAHVKDHITEKGLALVQAREAAAASGSKENPNDPSFVQSLLGLHEAMRNLVSEQFDSNSLFQSALKDAFELFVNKTVTCKYSNVELVAHFCDRVLKAGGEKLNESQTEELLGQIVQLFTFIMDKDLFAEIYRNLLSKRLLMARSASNDAERSMVSKLKLRCGAQFTGKIEGMMNDLMLGGDMQKDFASHLTTAPASARPPFDFGVTVLTTGFWPTYKSLAVTLPGTMQKCVEIFEEYYAAKTSHRKLSWVHALGTSTLKAHYARTYDLQVTTLQAALLMLFNTHTEGTMSFEAVRSALNIEEDVCKRVVHSLSCGKYQVLKKEPKGRTISTSDEFRFNEGFSCSFRKIRIPMASLDATHNPKRVQEDRSNAIEAAAVRIMKTRKILSHQELVTEVIKQLHFFKPNPKVIKRRIEHLIERDYLARDETKPNMYKYLA